MSTQTSELQKGSNGGAVATTQDKPLVKGRRALDILAEHLGIDPKAMIEVIKANCFRAVDPKLVTNEQLAAFCSVAAEMKLNPLIPGMLYAYPTKNGGIMPMIGPDAVYMLLSKRDDVEGHEVVLENDKDGTLVAATATIYLRGKRPVVKRVYLHEWQVKTNPNWTTRPAHMLEIRAIKQAARMVIHGLPLDEEEVRIVEAQSLPASPTADAEGSRSAALARQFTRQIEGAVPTAPQGPVEARAEERTAPAQPPANEGEEQERDGDLLGGEA